jgi:hypothetical protein
MVEPRDHSTLKWHSLGSTARLNGTAYGPQNNYTVQPGDHKILNWYSLETTTHLIWHNKNEHLTSINSRMATVVRTEISVGKHVRRSLLLLSTNVIAKGR